MIRIFFDFSEKKCEFVGKTTQSKDNSIVLCDNSATCTKEDIITAYRQYGTDCVRHLKGVYSFALWDETAKQLLVVRDRLGERLMYYTYLPNGIMFSSDLKELLPYIKYPTIRPHELAQPIRHNYPIEPQHTWIEQICRVRDGEYMVVNSEGWQLHTYYRRDYTPSFAGTKQEAIDECLRLMRQSVKRCIETAEGPVAVLLSGGIDSTSLAAFTQELQQDVHVFCAGYRGNKYTAQDERSDAKRFAEEKGLIYHEVELDVNDFQNYLNELLPYLDEPSFDVNCMVQYALYKKVAEMGFKMVLSGVGGDEHFYSLADHQRIVKILQLRDEFINLYPVKEHKKEYISYVLHNWKHLLWPTNTAIVSERNPTDWTFIPYKRFSKNATLQFGGSEMKFSNINVEYHYPQHENIVSHYGYLIPNFTTLMCTYFGNKLCAANGIDIRFPFLDPELVQFLDTIPETMKFDPSSPKQFQKEIMTGILPDYILYAKKRGFEPPFEFIWKMCGDYKYKHIKADYTFFNSMVADMIIDNLLSK